MSSVMKDLKQSKALIILWIMYTFTGAEDEVLIRVEGQSINVAITCGISQHNHTLYWRINGADYDLHDIPEVFTINGNREIILEEVNRNMNNWDFQCFTLDVDGSVNFGSSKTLIVIFDATVPFYDPDIIRPSIDINYQKLQTTEDIITFSVLYHNTPLCAEAEFILEAYRDSEVMNAASESSLQASQSFEPIGSGIFTIDNNASTYYRLKATGSNESCSLSSHYFYTFPLSGYDKITAEEGTATFEIPEHLHNNPSLQLIWSKDNITQCVCPPVEEIMPTCACNMQSDNNVVTISDYNISISNLTSVNVLLLAITTSDGCQGKCILRSITGAYRIIPQGTPEVPTVSPDTPTIQTGIGAEDEERSNITSHEEKSDKTVIIVVSSIVIPSIIIVTVIIVILFIIVYYYFRIRSHNCDNYRV